MRLLVRKESLRLAVRWSQRALFAGAFLLLGYCGFVMADTWLFQQRESRHFEQQLAGKVPTLFASPPSPPMAATAGLMGRLEIGRLGLSAMVMEGDDRHTLRRAVGHIPGTSLPGQSGNVVLTGHRDTFFRPLRNIRQDDIITLTTLQGQYRYRVLSTQVVSPDNVSVLDPGHNEILTLITCHPFYFVGAAPNRFIVRAERVPGPG